MEDNQPITPEIRDELIKKNLLSKNPTPANEDYLIKMVTSKEPSRYIENWREFFLTDFSRPFLSWISATVYKSDWREIQGSYYIFISEPGNDGTPYYRVRQFKRKYNAKLSDYLSKITLRQMYYEKNKDKGPNGYETVSIDDETKLIKDISGNEEIENPWFVLLIYDGDTNRLSANDLELLDRLNNAVAQLPEHEQVALKRGTCDDLKGDEIYDELLELGLVNPKRDIETLTVIDKQKAVANIKKRALMHLKYLMEQ